MSTEMLASLTAAIGVIIALVTFVIQARAQIRIQRAEYIYRLEDKYDEICRLRSERPELMVTAAKWANKPYAEMDTAEREYYHHGEMVLGFIEIATYMRYVDKTLLPKAFTTFVRPMIVLEMSYNCRLMKMFATRHDSSISEQSRRLIGEILSEQVNQDSTGAEQTDGGNAENSAPHP